MRLVFVAIVLTAVAFSAESAEEMHFTTLTVERLEWQFDADQLLFDMTAMHGGDEHRLEFKLEGHKPDGHDAEYSAQLVYNRPISPFFDLLLGVELIESDDGKTSGASIGIEGMAPQRIELDAHATFTEDGDVLIHGEFEREFLVTQKIMLLPRIEVSAALTDVGVIGAGFSEFEFEIRAQYQVTRKFAPDVGLSWQRALGDTQRQLSLAGEDTNNTVAVLGVSFWF